MSRSIVRTGLLITLLVGSLAACADEGAPTDAAPTTTGASTTTPAATTPPATEPTTSKPTPGPAATNGTTILSSPVDGAVVTGPTVTVTGKATAFEGSLNWAVYPAEGSLDDPEQQGSTMTGANGEVAPFEFTVDLQPGRWTISVFESSAKDGEPLNIVSAAVTVE